MLNQQPSALLMAGHMPSGEGAREDEEEVCEMQKMVPASVLEAISRAEKALNELREKLDPVVELTRGRSTGGGRKGGAQAEGREAGVTEEEEKDLSDLAPIERAKVHLVVANAATTLFCLLLKTEGVGIDDHAGVQKEVERVSRYGSKVLKEESRLKALAEGANPAAASAGLDAAAASRFIASGLPDLSPQQRRLLREAGAKRKRQQQEAREKARAEAEARAQKLQNKKEDEAAAPGPRADSLGGVTFAAGGSRLGYIPPRGVSAGSLNQQLGARLEAEKFLEETVAALESGEG